MTIRPFRSFFIHVSIQFFQPNQFSVAAQFQLFLFSSGNDNKTCNLSSFYFMSQYVSTSSLWRKDIFFSINIQLLRWFFAAFRSNSSGYTNSHFQGKWRLTSSEFQWSIKILRGRERQNLIRKIFHSIIQKRSKADQKIRNINLRGSFDML